MYFNMTFSCFCTISIMSFNLKTTFQTIVYMWIEFYYISDPMRQKKSLFNCMGLSACNFVVSTGVSLKFSVTILIQWCFVFTVCTNITASNHPERKVMSSESCKSDKVISPFCQTEPVFHANLKAYNFFSGYSLSVIFAHNKTTP